MKTLTYKTSVKLKEFLGKDAPVPMDRMYWAKSHYNMGPQLTANINLTCHNYYPAFTLEDILSRPFCEAVAINICPLQLTKEQIKIHEMIVFKALTRAYYKNGMEAVEAKLNKMMEAK